MKPPSPEETVAERLAVRIYDLVHPGSPIHRPDYSLSDIKAGILDVLKERDAAKDELIYQLKARVAAHDLDLQIAVGASEEAKDARIAELEASVVSHFQREHLEGDGPEIDRWRGRRAATAEVVKEMREALRRAQSYVTAPALWSEIEALLAEPVARSEDRAAAVSDCYCHYLASERCTASHCGDLARHHTGCRYAEDKARGGGR